MLEILLATALQWGTIVGKMEATDICGEVRDVMTCLPGQHYFFQLKDRKMLGWVEVPYDVYRRQRLLDWISCEGVCLKH